MELLGRKIQYLLILSTLFKLSFGACDEKRYPSGNCWQRFNGETTDRKCYLNYNYRQYGLVCTNLTNQNQIDYKESGWNVIVMIDINDSNINEIEENSFSNLTELVSLKMSNSKINEIQPDAFNGLSKLQYLFLDNSNLDALPNNMFNTTAKLRVIDLSHNKIKRIEEDLFLGLSELEELYLNYNQITNASFLSGNCKTLTHLDLSSNNIESLPYDNCTNLQTLRVGSNKINNFDQEIFKNSSLYHLDISNNGVSFIEAESLKHFTSLKFLNLSLNPLFKISDPRNDLFQNTKLLRYLGLSATSLKQIPFGMFTYLHELNELDLSFNSLSYLSKHDGARILHINDNRFTHFEYLGPIHKIYLNNNFWSCAVLAELVAKYEYQMDRGHTYNTTNIKGIGCSDSLEDPHASGAYGGSPVVNMLLEEYLSDFVHDQDEIMDDFDTLKYFVKQRNANARRFLGTYLNELRHSFFVRDVILYCITLVLLIGFTLFVFRYYGQRRNLRKDSDLRNLSSALEI